MLVQQTYKVRARKGQRCFRGYAYRKGRDRRAVINLGVIDLIRYKRHRGQEWLIEDIISTADHEIIHALILTSDWAPVVHEERFVKKCESAGRWARE
jgi:hypothetical protein